MLGLGSQVQITSNQKGGYPNGDSSMWVHGNMANIQLDRYGRGSGEDIRGFQWTAVEGFRQGNGTEYRCQDGSDYWFHFAIPTPVMINGTRTSLAKVMVLFTADTGVTLSSIHAWDGPTRVFTKDGLAIGGTNPSLNNGQNSFVIEESSRPKVYFGIGVCVKFHFADAGNVTLHAAGIDVVV